MMVHIGKTPEGCISVLSAGKDTINSGSGDYAAAATTGFDSSTESVADTTSTAGFAAEADTSRDD